MYEMTIMIELRFRMYVLDDCYTNQHHTYKSLNKSSRSLLSPL